MTVHVRTALFLTVYFSAAVSAQSTPSCPTVSRASAAPLPAKACTLSCGTDRWPVKTMSDRDAQRVDIVPRRSTITALTRLRRPASRPRDRRANVTERRVFCVDALVAIADPRPQEDGDLHVVLLDPADPKITLIAEFPDARCPAVCASRFAPAMGAARTAFERRLNTATTDTIRVLVVGVAFFDRNHGQIGAAPNFIELHPVLAVAFP